MKAITLRNIPPEVAHALRRKADEEGTSISKAIIRLLQQCVGAGGRKQRVHHDLDFLAGSWSSDEAAEFAESLRQQRAIDAEMWAE
jgi:hypothetical protein